MDVPERFLYFCRMPDPWEKTELPPFALVDRPILARNPPAWTWRVEVPQRFCNLWVLLEGRVEFELRSQKLRFDRPSYFCLPSGERVVARAIDGALLNFALHLAPTCAFAVGDESQLAGSWGTPVQEPEWFDVTARRCVELGHHPASQNQALSFALAQTLFLHFLRDTTLSRESSSLQTMRRLSAVMRLDPAHPWEIEAMAQEAGYSRSQFHRLFREVTGQSPRAFLTHCRMERARRLLIESTMNVSEIAEAAGYPDVYFFSRHFKQHAGVSPMGYRNAGE